MNSRALVLVLKKREWPFSGFLVFLFLMQNTLIKIIYAFERSNPINNYPFIANASISIPLTEEER